MHIVNSYANDIQHTENIVKSANYHFGSCQFQLGLLSVLRKFLQKALSPYFTPHVLLFSSLWIAFSKYLKKKLLTSICTLTFQNLSYNCVLGIRLLNLALVRNRVKTCNSCLHPHITIQSLTSVVNLERTYNILIHTILQS